MERAMKFQEVILRAVSKQITWMQAAEILGMSDRNMRRYRNRLEKGGYDGLLDRRTQRPSPKRVPMAEVERVLTLYREKYFDFNVRHFHEKLRDELRPTQAPDQRQTFRFSMAKCRVLICEQLDDTIAVYYGPNLLGRYDQAGLSRAR
jgi:hypothetical protein